MAIRVAAGLGDRHTYAAEALTRAAEEISGHGVANGGLHPTQDDA